MLRIARNHVRTPRGRILGILAALSACVLYGSLSVLEADPPTSRPTRTGKTEPPAEASIWTVAKLHDEAADLRRHFPAPIVQKFLDAVKSLPSIKTRTMIINRETKQARLIPDGAKPELKPGEIARELSEEYYYTTHYGTPLAYSRPMQILSDNGIKTLASTHILDFGYGTIGHLRLWASCGADVVGVEVDPTTEALYSLPGDIGIIKGVGGAPDGKITLTTGHWPADKFTRDAVRGGYDIIISKNTLKRGYVHPSEPVDKRLMVDLGVPDEEFVAEVAMALKPGGKFLIFNICPAPAKPGKPFIPWSDGHCPFDRKLLEKGGLKVIAFDVDDTAQVKEMAKGLGWDKGGMDVENDLFAWYTLATKP